ncbi:hypothetical protein [Glutamicibacter creatinolyticus]|uniref:hypothetical protein n=1 Tax=Glutamicibacter creatinolyticus TaxID=162496 RepID=UPI0031DC3AC2
MTIVARSRVESTISNDLTLDSFRLIREPRHATTWCSSAPEDSSAAASWALTRSISPRPTVRVARRDAYGQVVNEYDTTHRVLGHVPTSPWAVYLADTDGLFHLIGIDLDAKNEQQAELAAAEALSLSRHMDAVGIEHVVCESGQSGGRHLWVALAEPMARADVLALRHAIKQVATRLDHSNLTNPATGCLRPPGAPHRDGSSSIPLKGDLNVLLTPTTQPVQVREFTARLELVASPSVTTHSNQPVNSAVTVDEVNRRRKARARSQGQGKTVGSMSCHPDLPVDEQGMPYLPGVKRTKLPVGSQQALERKLSAEEDASAVFWTIVLGAARASWRYTDLLHLVDRAPGLEHARTKRAKAHGHTLPGRIPRSAASQKYLLEWTWLKATTQVFTQGAITGADPEFEHRQERIHALVSSTQQRATASVGRWDPHHYKSGPTDRRVLDALCLWTLQAVQPAIEADIRRLALTCGIGRETARQALLRLEAHEWIKRTKTAEGIHGAWWSIDPQNSFHRTSPFTRPQGGEAAAMGFDLFSFSELAGQLEERLTLSAHDCFTPGALSHYLGNVFSHLSQKPGSTIEELSQDLGSTKPWVAAALDRLHDHGLCASNGANWVATPPDSRDQVARLYATSGVLATRETLYRIERELWDWWQQELTWMTSPRDKKTLRAIPGQLHLIESTEQIQRRTKYPRGASGLADHRQAKAFVEQKILTPQLTAA